MMMTDSQRKAIRVDLQVIADMIDPGTRVLDIGCSDGALLEYLSVFKQVDGRGIELSPEGVKACVSAGLSVIQGDAETDLEDYPDDAFDYVVLSHTLQAMQRPRRVLDHLLRIGRHAIVSLPNFGYWRVRTDLLLRGRMPVTETLSYEWYDTPNIHFCTFKDFVVLCDEMDVTIERAIILDHSGGKWKFGGRLRFANLMGEQAVFQLRRNG